MQLIIDTDEQVLSVDGSKISFLALDHMVNPNPTLWYRFERNSYDRVLVTVQKAKVSPPDGAVGVE